jgi:hypothetical protein
VAPLSSTVADCPDSFRWSLGAGAVRGCNRLRRARQRASRVLGMSSSLGVKVPCAT